MRASLERYRRLGSVLAAAVLAAYGAASAARARESVRAPASSEGKAKQARPTSTPLQPATLIGANIRVNDPNAEGDGAVSHIQSETAIAVNPISGTLCVAFNDYSGFGTSNLGFASSSDDGATFQDHGAFPQVPQGGGDPAIGPVSDPALVWRRFDGKFYFVSVVGFADGLALWVSNDDCKTFTPIMRLPLASNDADKPLAAVDNDPASARYGRMYVTYKDEAQRIAIISSDDLATWSAPTDLSPSGPKANGSWPVVLNGGTLYVFWSQMNGATYDVKYVSTTTGGAPYSAVASAVSGAITPYSSAFTTDPLAPSLTGNIRYQAFPEVAAGSDGCLHLTYAVGPNTSHTGDCSDVYYRRSCNGGAWSAALKINDDATATDQWMPSVSVGAGGIVSIGYYDRRVSTGNINFRYYNRISLDNGATFQASTAISSVTSPVALETQFANYHGDYDMQLQRPGALYILWSDDRTVTAGANSPDVFFQKACPQSGCTIAPAQPRQIAPLSGSKVTSRRPQLKVKLGNGSSGVRVDVCRDRACTNIFGTYRATGTTVTPGVDLPTGMLFWRAYGTSGATDGLASSATWEFRVTALNAAVKSSWGAEPDYNGDGRADVAFAAHAAGQGKVYVFNSDGSAGGIPSTASRVLVAPNTADTTFGQTVVSAGDLNGDGFADLVVGASRSNSGVLYVYYGSSSGIASRPAQTISAPNAPAVSFGRAQALGDINGDGYGDLLVTDAGFIGASTYGRAYTFFGGPAGLPAAPSQTFDPPLASAYYFFGYYGGSAGDVNGDGIGDAVIASYAPTTTSATFLYLGSTAGLKTPTQINAVNALVVASHGIAFGDVNGDGRSDITVAAAPSGGGNPFVCLYPGQAAAPGIATNPLTYGDAPGVMLDEELNGDGLEELVMAITATSTSPGVVYVYPGSAFGYIGIAGSTINGPDGNDSAWANSVSALGDVDGDGRLDLGVSAAFAASRQGKWYLYKGIAGGGVATTPAKTLTGSDGASSFYGFFMGGIENAHP